MADHTCEQCGAAFSRPGKRPYKFCGHRCSALSAWKQPRAARAQTLHRRTGAMTEEQRQRQIEAVRSPAVIAKRTASMRASAAIEHPTDFVCDHCGVTFTTYPGRRPKPLKFCTRACCHAWQKANGGQGQRAIKTADVEMPFRPPSGTHPGNVYLEAGEIKQERK